jgi:uncharacterized protein YndB with AHSA1/START domain
MAPERVVTSLDIKATIEQTWHEITKTGALQRACFNTLLVGDLKPGSPYRYTSYNGKHTFIKGTILEVDPPRRLAMTFKFLGAKVPESKLVYELQAIPGGVRVTIVHEGLDLKNREDRQFADGWKSFLKNLRALLETGDVPFGTRVQYFIFKLILPFMPKRDG